MDSVTGSETGRDAPPSARTEERPDAFSAPPRAVVARRERQHAIRTSVGIVVAIALAGSLGALNATQRAAGPESGAGVAAAAPDGPSDGAGQARVSRPPLAPGDPAIDRRSAIRLFRFQAPSGFVSSAATDAGSRRLVVALPGCEVTVQLAGGQPRRLRECIRRAPGDLGTLVIGPREALRFEVPGWVTRIEDRSTIVGPAREGTWTIEIPTCLSRSGDWLCGKWYATVEVRT